MNAVTLDDIDILDVGNAIQIGGAIWTGRGKVYIVPLPDEDLAGEIQMLRMDAAQWERFLQQSDYLDVRGPQKAILRKSQRQIDQAMSWRVYKRDGYRCRYCGGERPLTVDHIILWENGGATVEDNLISACRRCNKLRGNVEYDVWLASEDYKIVSAGLLTSEQQRNTAVVAELGRLRAIKVKPRSR